MKFVRSLLVVMAAAMVPLVPAAAEAQTYTQLDSVGDVEGARYPITSGWPFAPVPDRADGDIISSSVSHRRHTVRIEVVFRELTHVQNQHDFLIKSNRRNRHVEVWAGLGGWRGRHHVTTFRGKVVPCRVRHDIDYDANRVIVKVPRSCLGKPRWVQVAITATTITDSPSRIYLDDARGHFLPDSYLYTPRIRRGPGLVGSA